MCVDLLRELPSSGNTVTGAAAPRRKDGRGREQRGREQVRSRRGRERGRAGHGIMGPPYPWPRREDSGVGRQGGMGTGPVATVEEGDDSFATKKTLSKIHFLIFKTAGF